MPTSPRGDQHEVQQPDSTKPGAHQFLDKLRTRYGSTKMIGASVPEASGMFADAVRQVAQERTGNRVRHWNYADPALDRLGRDWHFSQHDHGLISGLLNDHIAKLGPVW